MEREGERRGGGEGRGKRGVKGRVREGGEGERKRRGGEREGTAVVFTSLKGQWCKIFGLSFFNPSLPLDSTEPKVRQLCKQI